MAVEIVDLCSSPESEDSPRKAAEGALAGFKPRKEKTSSITANPSGTSGAHNDFDFSDDQFTNATTTYEEPKRYSIGGDQSFVFKSKESNNIEILRGQRSSPPSRQNGFLVEYTNNESRNGDLAYGQESAAQTSETYARGLHPDYKSEQSARAFRVDKSKRYGHSTATSSLDKHRPTTPVDTYMPDRPLSSARLKLSMPKSPGNKRPTSVNGTSTTQTPSQNGNSPNALILSGAGLEVVRMQNSSMLSVGERENDIKRQASPSVDSARSHTTKRPRTDEGPLRRLKASGHVSNRSSTVLIDVTDPDAERVSYSDEPDVKESVGTPKRPALAILKPGRTGAIQKRADFSQGPNRRGEPYSPEEDELLCQLKADGLSWGQIVRHFNGRTEGSLAVRFSSKFAHRNEGAGVGSARLERKKASLLPVLERIDSSDNVAAGRPRRARNTAPSAVDGFVSWASMKASSRELAAARHIDDDKEDDHVESPEPVLPQPLLRQDGTFPASMSQILRQRELGLNGRRSWCSSPRAIRDDVKNHVHQSYVLKKQYHGTSGDVVALSWAPDGDRFAAGSIAISDSRSMQYNMRRNLVVGSRSQSKLRELTEHHVDRPVIDTDSDNVNRLHAMRASQDSRLFKTVTATAFSPSSSKKLYTTGEDRMLRCYAVGKDVNTVKCRYEIKHAARLDLLSMSTPHGIVATGCHADTNSVQLYRCHERSYEAGDVFSPSRSDLQSSVPIYPSALKWGIAYQHCAFLLAGFCGDEEKELAGETCLWDINTGTAFPVRSPTRSVFDVAWNPNPSSASITFAVASNPSSLAVAKSTRSVIQCFAPNQNGARRVITWESPAADINDVLFCPYDDNLIAAGATNGTVYVWDLRSAARSQKPLHILHHGATENVLDHHRDPETADTGVRFLSWGATRTRLYSGSHDGIVKVWNPYRSPENTHVDDITPPTRERSAVMSGTFSQDHRELLIGTENGRINLFSVDGAAVYKPQQFKLETEPSPAETKQRYPSEQDPFATARSMIDSGKIEIRSCGAMPIRQAVQGPHYDGPFLAPTTEEISQAEERCTQAMIRQRDAHMRQAGGNPDDDDDDDKTRADSQALAAQHALDELNQRLKHFHFAQPKAEGFQRSLFKAEEDRAKLLVQLTEPVDPCKLNCCVLPTSDEVEDSGRSELRIPQVLRSIEHTAALSYTGDDPAAAECVSCFPSRALKQKGKPLCVDCTLRKARLTVSCNRCAGAARLQTDTSKETLCERCAFACFRCNGAVTFDAEMTIITCSACNLTWELGALGYELITAPERLSVQARVQQDDKEQYDDFGTHEMEHYASLWQDTDAHESLEY